MTISTRFALGISAAALSLSLGGTSAALAQLQDETRTVTRGGPMVQDLEFRNSLSRRDTTSTDTIAKDAKDQGHHWGAAFQRR